MGRQHSSMPRSIMKARKNRKEAAGQARQARCARMIVQERDMKARAEQEKLADEQRAAWKKAHPRSEKIRKQCHKLAQVYGADAPVVVTKLIEAKHVSWREDRIADRGQRSSLGVKYKSARSSKRRALMC